MTPRRRAPKRASRRASTNGAHAFAVVVEQLRGDMRGVIEAVQGCAKTSDLLALQGHVEVIGTDLRSLTRDVGTLSREVGALSRKVGGLTRDVGSLTHKVDALTAEVAHKAEGATLVALEQRVTVLERRAGA